MTFYDPEQFVHDFELDLEDEETSFIIEQQGGFGGGGRGRGRGRGGKRAAAPRRQQQQQQQPTGFFPKIDRFEKGENIIVLVELPGLTKQDLNVSLHDTILTISGTTAHLKECGDDPGHAQQCERRFGAFSRSIRVPRGLQDSEVKATMEHGLLRLEFPKGPREGQGMKIEIA